MKHTFNVEVETDEPTETVRQEIESNLAWEYGPQSVTVVMLSGLELFWRNLGYRWHEFRQATISQYIGVERFKR
jgi:hypothetical protein